MLLKPGSRVSNTRPTAQSTGEIVANSSYLVRGPHRDLNTLPLRQEPPSFEEATLQSETNGHLTEPGKGKYAGRRPKHPQSTSGPSKGPLDPTVTKRKYPVILLQNSMDQHQVRWLDILNLEVPYNYSARPLPE